MPWDSPLIGDAAAWDSVDAWRLVGEAVFESGEGWLPAVDVRAVPVEVARLHGFVAVRTFSGGAVACV